MPSQGTAIRQYVHAVARHSLALVGSAIVTLLSFVMDWLKPSWWVSPRVWFYAAVIGAGLFVSQFLAWNDLRKKIAALKQEARTQIDLGRRAAAEVEFDLRFGPKANEPPGQRFDLLTQHFRKLEREIECGDFSNAVEVLALKDIMIAVLRGHFAGGQGYAEWNDRLFKLVAAVHRHQRELVEKLEG